MRVIVFLSLLLLFGCEEQKPPYQWKIPADFPQPQVPDDNPMSEDKVTLGRFLFYDKNLSANQKQSCAGCHQQDRAFAEMIPVSIGSTGQSHHRNSQALVNVAYNKSLTWAHSELVSIEQQVLLPMFGENPIELGIMGHDKAVLSRFDNPHYRPLFEKAFGDDDVSYDKIVKALASFVRSLLSFNSRFDNYAYRMQDNALSKSEIRGMDLFFSERLECHHCHGGFNFTQSTSHQKQILKRNAFHNTGLYNVDENGAYPLKDQGLYAITGVPQDMGKFRAPTLRNIALTAPYMHDGSIEELSSVIDFYARGGRKIEHGAFQGDGKNNPYKSPFMKGFELSEQEKIDLLAFLNALTDPTFISNPAHSNPFKAN